MRRVETKIAELEEPPEDLIKVYKNKDLVRIRIKRRLYERLEEKAKKLETTPDKLIYNAILLILKTEHDAEYKIS